MVFEFKFPDIGEGITKGKVVGWVVKEGDSVKEDQTIAKVETDKALADIPSPKTGKIEKIMVQAGSDVAVGQTLVTIAVEGEESGPAPAPIESQTTPEETIDKKDGVEATKKDSAPSDGGTGAVGELESASEKTNLFDFSKAPTPTEPSKSIPTPESKTGEAGLAMPGIKQIAKAQGIDISSLQGTGPQGSVRSSDLGAPMAKSQGGTLKIQSPSGDIIEITGNVSGINFVKFGGNLVQSAPELAQEETKQEPDSQPAAKESPATTSKPGAVKRKYDQYGYLDRKPYDGVRKVIGENMRKSVDAAAHVTAMDEVDVTDLWKMQEAEAKKAKKKGVILTFLPYISRAAINTLRKVPSMNATLDEENNEIIYKKYYNIGQAVATEAGLMVIVIKRAEHKTLYLIGKEIHDLADKARKRKIDLSELKGSSFTITNWGSIHGSYGTPIINPGNSAILGVGRIRQVAAFVGKKVEPRYLLPVSLSFDHKITDGAEAATFLKELRNQLENPTGLTDKIFMKGLKKEEIFDI